MSRPLLREIIRDEEYALTERKDLTGRAGSKMFWDVVLRLFETFE